MFINKAPDGKNNLIGENIAKHRAGMQLSQRALADRLQINGLGIDKNAVQRMECGKRFITDIELVVLCRALRVTPNELLGFYEE